MIIIDTALEQRARAGNPIRVGIIGAGSMGRGIVQHIVSAYKGMRVAAVYNRTIGNAEKAFQQSGVENYEFVHNAGELDNVIADGRYAVTDDPMVVCDATGIDAIVECTGEIDFGAHVILRAIEKRKHVIMMNAELDATVGPILKVYADRAGVVITNVDGDQPGVVMNLFRWVKTIGYSPVLVGNIKGMLDHYRTPETQRRFAEANKQSPKMVTSFADGTKLCFEMVVTANATGFGVATRGMYGPACAHANDAPSVFPCEELLAGGGVVDYILGAEPGPGVFVIGHAEDPVKRHYMEYFKMGPGPFYTFYTPYHLPHVETPVTVARAVLFHDAATAPIGAPVCEAPTIAKRDLKAGEELDGFGGFLTYGSIENYEACLREDLLPMGLSDGCVLKRDVRKDEAISYADVQLPAPRLCDRLRAEQNAYFSERCLATAG